MTRWILVAKSFFKYFFPVIITPRCLKWFAFYIEIDQLLSMYMSVNIVFYIIIFSIFCSLICNPTFNVVSLSLMDNSLI